MERNGRKARTRSATSDAASQPVYWHNSGKALVSSD